MTEQKQTGTKAAEASDVCGCMCACVDFSKMTEMMGAFCGGKEGDVDFSGMMAKMKDCCTE